MKDFATTLSDTLTETLNEHRTQGWKNAQKDLRELIGIADGIVSALTNGVLGITMQVSLKDQIHYMVFYNHAENKTIGNLEAFQLSSSGGAEKTEYPILALASGIRLGNRGALEGFIVGHFAGSRHHMIETIAQVMEAVKDAKKKGK